MPSSCAQPRPTPIWPPKAPSIRRVDTSNRTASDSGSPGPTRATSSSAAPYERAQPSQPRVPAAALSGHRGVERHPQRQRRARRHGDQRRQPLRRTSPPPPAASSHGERPKTRCGTRPAICGSDPRGRSRCSSGGRAGRSRHHLRRRHRAAADRGPARVAAPRHRTAFGLDLRIEEIGGDHWWHAFVDAQTGASLGQVDLIVHDPIDGIAAIARPDRSSAGQPADVPAHRWRALQRLPHAVREPGRRRPRARDQCRRPGRLAVRVARHQRPGRRRVHRHARQQRARLHRPRRQQHRRPGQRSRRRWHVDVRLSTQPHPGAATYRRRQ